MANTIFWRRVALPEFNAMLLFTIWILAIAVHGDKPGNKLELQRVDDMSSYPYQVSVYESRESKSCGGAILSPRHVLTTGTCVSRTFSSAPVAPSKVRVRAGSARLDRGGRLHEVARIHAHPDYLHFRKSRNLALLELSEPLQLDASRRPVVGLAAPPAPGSLVNVSAWEEDGELRAGPVPVIADNVCDLSYGLGAPYLEPGVLCAGYHNVKSVAVEAAGLGSPLVFDGQLVGVASSGDNEKRPVIYTEVYPARDWIAQVTGL